MKRIIFPILMLLLVSLACSFGSASPTAEADTAPAADSAEAPTMPPPTEAAPAPPPEQESAPSEPPPAPGDASASPAPQESDIPGAGKKVDITQLSETDTDFLGVYEIVPKPYETFVKAGGRVVNLEPMDTFFTLWVPEGYETMETRRVVVIAHGHGGNAYRELGNELKFAREHGYAIVAIQWGEAEGERMFSAQHFYAFMDAALQYMAYKYNAQVDKCALRGWSLGSEISFEVTYLDRINGTNYLALTISHDGGMMPDASQMAVGREFTTALYNGEYGQDTFEGKHFYLYAGQPDQARNMRNTSEVITSHGGIVEKLVEDVGAGHDGFYRHPQYHEEALQIFFQLAP